MAATKRKVVPIEGANKAGRPTLIKIGKEYVNPNDVSSIRHVKSKNLYVVDMVSRPEPKFALWVSPKEIGDLIQYFNIITTGE